MINQIFNTLLNMESSNEALDSCNAYLCEKDSLRFSFRFQESHSKQASYFTNHSLAKNFDDLRPHELLAKYYMEKPRHRQHTASRRKDSTFTETKTPNTKT